MNSFGSQEEGNEIKKIQNNLALIFADLIRLSNKKLRRKSIASL